MFLYVILLIYIILLIYNIYNLKNYDKDANLITNKKRINNKYPHISNIDLNFDLDSFIDKNINYLLIDNNNYIHLSNLKDDNYNNTIFVHKNYKLYNDLFKNIMGYKKYGEQNLINYESISIYKGKTISDLIKVSSKDNIIYQLYGDSIIYIFNPKNKDNILNKNKEEIYKWSEKIKMKQFDLLRIPSEWYYILETNTKSIFYFNESNDIFSIYNYYFNI